MGLAGGSTEKRNIGNGSPEKKGIEEETRW